ncbi:MAG: PCMD domain-containing protein [Rikenellaceae bacterium]
MRSKILAVALTLFSLSHLAIAQNISDVAAQTLESKELIKYGDMEQWLTRKVEESGIIGGAEKTVYEIATHIDMEPNTPYIPTDSPWATSSVFADVMGVKKGSITVFSDKRGNDGTAALLETRIETVKVLGLINISVLATGTIYLGQTYEPVRDTKNPQSKLLTGIPFTKRPKAMEFDYKVDPADVRLYAPGFGRNKELEGKNAAEAVVILQRRWEDSMGNIYAHRVATGWDRFDKKVDDWQNNYRIDLLYGNITSRNDFEEFKGLLENDMQTFTKNSKGEVVPVYEIGWDDENSEPTHIIIRFSSSYGGAYVGSVGSKFWIDNVSLIY